MKLEGFYADLDGDIKKRFETFNYEVKKPLPTEKKTTKKIGWRPKIHSYFTDDRRVNK